MKKWSLVGTTLMLAVFSWAQVVPATPIPANDAVATPPPSSIDLLKRSLGTSNVSASAGRVSQSSSTTAATPVTASTSSSAGTSTTKQTVAPVAKNVLEMPIAGGKVVTTQVPTKPNPNKISKNKGQVSTNAKTSVKATVTEQEIEKNNALAEGERKGKPLKQETTVETEMPMKPTPSEEDVAAQAELEYAARMLEQSKKEATSGRFIPPSASQAEPVPATPAASRNYNPLSYRPGVEWRRTDSTHFTIYTQKRTGGISSSNMSMIFETAYATLRRYIPWMMSNKVRVFVYQDHNSYLKHEPNAKAWTRALAYPTRGEIVVYDEPGKQQELKEVFTHELVHVFTQQFFDKYKTGHLMTPAWLDEGLAVFMEDQAYNGNRGGPWNHDLKTLNFQRNPQTQVANFSSRSMFGSSRSFAPLGNRRKGKPVILMPFDQFMEDGSLEAMEARNKTQDWYFQAYAMVRFLLNPAGGSSPSNRMQFEQFTRLMAQGEQVRVPNSGFPVRDKNGKPVYQPYSVEKAMGRAYRYNSASNFEDAFWRWANNQ